MPDKCSINSCKNLRWKVNKERKFRGFLEDRPLGFHK
ncbi:hypothetical protein Bhyg_03903 [Pseudolycoriella hygida]|uniref:Uncharacterized protein n=1 Tax=Pseudolycoriella hygida TaxID=35572 RepID=A0A9Q0NEW5_9DIPT|nr:hypothetical protein Bhyg_03903 [Pseudolycoriella hygida]